MEETLEERSSVATLSPGDQVVLKLSFPCEKVKQSVDKEEEEVPITQW